VPNKRLVLCVLGLALGFIIGAKLAEVFVYA
jgi:hypothetical protein